MEIEEEVKVPEEVKENVPIYERIRFLGDGSFSKVYLYKNHQINRLEAWKVFNNCASLEMIANEYQVLQ